MQSHRSSGVAVAALIALSVALAAPAVASAAQAGAEATGAVDTPAPPASTPAAEATPAAPGAKKGPSVRMKIATEIVTHVVAFLLFVLILYVTAWKPLLKVIDDRRDKIAADFKKAEDLATGAEKARGEYEASLRQIEGEARQKMHESIEEGKRIAAELQQRAHDEADQIIQRAHATADIEMANARKELRKEVIELTLALTEKVLREQLDRGEHTRYIDRYIDELGGMKS